MIGVGIRHESRYRDEAELDIAAERQDGHAHADVAGLWHPEHHLIEFRAGQIKRVLGPGHIGHDSCGAAEQQVEQLVLHDLWRIAERREQAEGHRRLVGFLQFGHATPHFMEALDGIGDSTGSSTATIPK